MVVGRLEAEKDVMLAADAAWRCRSCLRAEIKATGALVTSWLAQSAARWNRLIAWPPADVIEIPRQLWQSAANALAFAA